YSSGNEKRGLIMRRGGKGLTKFLRDIPEGEFMEVDILQSLLNENGQRGKDWASSAVVEEGPWVETLLYGFTKCIKTKLIEEKDETGWTTHQFAIRGSVEMAEALLGHFRWDERREVIRAKDSKGRTAVQFVAIMGKVEVMKFLLSHLSKDERLEAIRERN